MTERRIAPTALDLGLKRLRVIPASAVATMKRSLVRHGQITPLVAGQEESGRLALIDGFKRQQAAVELGLAQVDVLAVALTPVTMKAQVYLCNRTEGFTLVEECLLISELYRVDGMSQVEIADLLQRHKSWVCRRMQFFERVSPHLLDDLRVGLVQPGSARELARLPRGNQEEVAAAVTAHKLGPEDTRRLVRLYRAAPSAQAREFVLRHPIEALKGARGDRPERALDCRLPCEARTIDRGLRTLTQVCHRVAAILHTEAGGVDRHRDPGLSDSCRQALAAMARVSALIHNVTRKGGPDEPERDARAHSVSS